MTIIYCGEGDILYTKMQTTVIPVNTVGVMGKGLTFWFKKYYPTHFKQYRKYCLSGKFDIGNLMLIVVHDRQYLLFPTKKHWNAPSEKEYLIASFKKLTESYKERGITSLCFPAVGCGAGELKFEDVKVIMYEYLDPLDIPVEIFLKGW